MTSIERIDWPLRPPTLTRRPPRPRMTQRHPIVHVLRNIAGTVLVLLGVLGLFLPFLQGVLFLVLGLGLIDHPLKRRAHHWFRHRFPPYRAIALRYMRWKRQRRLSKHGPTGPV